MKTVNITAFMNTKSCDKCGNNVLYDDTPYHLIKNIKNLVFELACFKCGTRKYYTSDFKKIV